MSQGEINIEVVRIHRFENGKGLKAFADIKINDCLLISGLKILDGETGRFVAMPREQSKKDNKWYETVRCLRKEIKDQISNEILSVYSDQANQAVNV